MKKIILILLLVTTNVIGQKTYKDIINQKTFDFKNYEKRIKKDPSSVYYLPDSTKIKELKSPDGTIDRWTMFPRPNYGGLYQEYHPNGRIKRITNMLGRIEIGETYKYDKKGYTIAIIDEDEKFKGNSYEVVLNFLRNKNFQDPRKRKQQREFEFYYNKKKWFVMYYSYDTDYEISYTIDAESGKLLKKEKIKASYY